MASIREKAISILAGNLNSGRSNLITAVPDFLNYNFEILTDSFLISYTLFQMPKLKFNFESTLAFESLGTLYKHKSHKI